MQNILALLIVFLAAGYTVYAVVRALRSKRSAGCTGCSACEPQAEKKEVMKEQS